MAEEVKDAKALEMAAALEREMAVLTGTQRAAVLMLLLGEQQAAEIIRYLNPKEVQSLGAAMVSVADLSQEAVNAVLDEFVATIKKQTNLGLGTTDYVEKVLKRALGEDKAASVINRIMPGQGSKGLDILEWMDARSIADMIRGEHPQVTAIILSLLENQVAADVLTYLPDEARPEIMQRVASTRSRRPSAGPPPPPPPAAGASAASSESASALLEETSSVTPTLCAAASRPAKLARGGAGWRRSSAQRG
jgi:flagellar motor switch protein FliG